MGYYKKFGKVSLNTSAYYQHATDVFSFISFDTGETVDVNGQTFSVIERTPINLAEEDRYGFEFTLTYNPIRKWNINANFNIFRQSITGTDPNGLSLDNDNTSWFARLNNKYTLPGKIEWQTSLNYRGPSEDAQNKREGVFSANMAFSRDIFNENASIALNVSDLLNSRKRTMDTTTPTYTGTQSFNGENVVSIYPLPTDSINKRNVNNVMVMVETIWILKVKIFKMQPIKKGSQLASFLFIC